MTKKFETKFDYFVHYAKENGFYEQWQINEANSDWRWNKSFIHSAFEWGKTEEGHDYWRDISIGWMAHLEKLDCDDILVQEEDDIIGLDADTGVEENTKEIDFNKRYKMVTDKEIKSQANLSHILDFYVAITGEDVIKTDDQKELLIKIIDICNEY
jgi:hypothetical protein